MGPGVYDEPQRRRRPTAEGQAAGLPLTAALPDSQWVTTSHGVVHAPREAKFLFAASWVAVNWSVVLLLAITAVVYLGSAGISPLLDDTDSLYAEVAREMSLRADWITPYVDGIRYLEKPPLFYWLMALSYWAFDATTAFAARLPTALAVTALVAVTFDIGRLLFGMRVGVLGALALATSAGLFLFTRIVLPDAPLTLLLALVFDSFIRWERSGYKTAPLLAMYAFAAGAVLAKGLIGVVFPIVALGINFIATGRAREVPRLISWKGIGLFFAICAPWHIVAGWRNPGFFWFYFVNEHVLRFLGQRLPMDYGTVPLVPFWLLHLVWLFPWSIYLTALAVPANWRRTLSQDRNGTVLLLCWAGAVIVFFSFSSRLEYYSLPAFPALALLAGVQCASCWDRAETWPGRVLAAVGAVLGVALLGAAALNPDGIAEKLLAARTDPDVAIFYFGHLLDLTAQDVAAFRVPLLIAGTGLGLGLPLHQLMTSPRLKAASLAASMLALFYAADLALAAFAPHLTTKALADVIDRAGQPVRIIFDGDFEDFSSVLFYTHQRVMLYRGGSTNLAYGARFPDAPPLLVGDEQLRRTWTDKAQRVFVVLPADRRASLDAAVPSASYVIGSRGDKILVSNRDVAQHLSADSAR